jgi:DNA-binding MarR family transcriptional regulator
MTSRLARNRTASNNGLARNRELIGQFSWAVNSINVHFQEIRQFLAKSLGISAPQWMILMTISDLDRGEGVSVKAVAKMIQVDPSFVTTQSKMLEKKGLVRRRTSAEDARVVQMSLSDKAYKHIENGAAQRESLNAFIFAELDGREFADLTSKLVHLASRFEKASVKVAIDL